MFKNIEGKEVGVMEIRRSYFTDEQKELKQQEEETKKEYSAMTEEARGEAEKIMKQRWDAICADVAEEQKHMKRIIDMQKLEFFKEMSEHAISWAEGVTADLYAGITGQLYGQIKFVTDVIIFNEETPMEFRAYFVKLVQTADEVSFYSTGNVYVMEFYYKLFREYRV